MATPTTPDQFLDLVQRSDLVPPDRWAKFLGQLTPNALLTRTPTDLAQQLIQEGHLTEFQSEQLLQGKYRGFNVGKYRVLERLGVGAMGTVYLCEHPGMRRRVAVKVLPASLASNPNVLARFQREAKAMAAIDHVNLVQAHDIDQDGQMHFLVMDYVDGVNLQQLVLRAGPLHPLRVAHYIHQAAQGLQHAHEAGLVHRDIKPSNLLVDRQGVVRLLDMGLARFFHDHEDMLTLQYDDKIMLGTVDYVAPEQVRDSHDVDIRADIYSLGATFYFLLAGQTMFPEGTKPQKLAWQQHRQPTPIQKLRANVPAGLAAILQKMLAKEPENRYQTPSEIVTALTPFTQSPIPVPTEEELPQRSLAARAPVGPRSMIPGGERPPTPRPAPAPVAVVSPSAIAKAESNSGTPSFRPRPQPVLTAAPVAPPQPTNRPRWAPHSSARPWTPRAASVPTIQAPSDLVPYPVAEPVNESPSLSENRPIVTPPKPPLQRRTWPTTAIFVGVVVTFALALGIGAGWVLNAATPTPPVKNR